MAGGYAHQSIHHDASISATRESGSTETTVEIAIGDQASASITARDVIWTNLYVNEEDR
jgi:hypothetical protein